jgi:hypothetical protein
LKSATLRWWQAIDRGAVHVGGIDHFLSELDWDQDLIRFWRSKTGLGRDRHDAVFQPHDADDNRLRRHRAGRSVCAQPANLEAVIGPFYLAITVARLVTLELEGRRL